MASISGTYISPRAHRLTVSKAINRLDSLDGITLGLLHNSKPNASILLDAVAAGIEDRVSLREVVRTSKIGPSNAAPDEVYSLLADRCGAVIFASAD